MMHSKEGYQDSDPTSLSPDGECNLDPQPFGHTPNPDPDQHCTPVEAGDLGGLGHPA